MQRNKGRHACFVRFALCVLSFNMFLYSKGKSTTHRLFFFFSNRNILNKDIDNKVKIYYKSSMGELLYLGFYRMNEQSEGNRKK